MGHRALQRCVATANIGQVRGVANVSLRVVPRCLRVAPQRVSTLLVTFAGDDGGEYIAHPNHHGRAAPATPMVEEAMAFSSVRAPVPPPL